MRIVFKEITPERIIAAAKRRIEDIPEAMMWSYSNHAKINRKKVGRFHNAHQGRRCFIIANGPSLNKMDLSVLKNEYTFSMNRAYLLYENWGFQPSFFVCINELVIEQFADDIKKLSVPKFLNYNCRQFFNSDNADDSLLYLRTGLHLNDRFSGDVSRAISSGGTVTFACLQLAYYMGFAEVILIGMDHSFVEKGTPNKTVVRDEDKDESHCHPSYFPKGIKWQLPDLYRSELAYALARQAFEADGRHIFDATVNGKCKVFNKKDFQSFF